MLVVGIWGDGDIASDSLVACIEAISQVDCDVVFPPPNELSNTGVALACEVSCLSNAGVGLEFTLFASPVMEAAVALESEVSTGAVEAPDTSSGLLPPRAIQLAVVCKDSGTVGESDLVSAEDLESPAAGFFAWFDFLLLGDRGPFLAWLSLCFMSVLLWEAV